MTREEMIIETLNNNQGMTMGEMAEMLHDKYQLPVRVAGLAPSYALGQLESSGRVVRGTKVGVPKRRCVYTGHLSESWFTTNLYKELEHE